MHARGRVAKQQTARVVVQLNEGGIVRVIKIQNRPFGFFKNVPQFVRVLHVVQIQLPVPRTVKAFNGGEENRRGKDVVSSNRVTSNEAAIYGGTCGLECNTIDRRLEHRSMVEDVER